jgi:hypothetical protein
MQNLIATTFRVTFDLIAGTAAANMSEFIFQKDFDALTAGKEMTSVSNEEVLTAKAIRIWLQLLFTVFVDLELRGLYTSEDTVDPTGGMVFIWAASQMPKFWARVQELSVQLRSRLFSVGLNKPILAE